MKREKGKEQKAEAWVQLFPVIGHAGSDELVILRGLEKMDAEIITMKQAVWALITKRNVIDDKGGLGLTCNLMTGEIRRRG
ncbi:MAG: hypothetical protein WC455_19210 [Dehalococcoidia bacterium]|jgi:hypothetical protein